MDLYFDTYFNNHIIEHVNVDIINWFVKKVLMDPSLKRSGNGHVKAAVCKMWGFR